jgi:hypothetical protein
MMIRFYSRREDTHMCITDVWYMHRDYGRRPGERRSRKLWVITFNDGTELDLPYSDYVLEGVTT